MTSSPSPTPLKKPFNPWPAAIIGFFVLAFAGVATLVTISVSNRTDLVAPDYYDQEMRFQKRIDQVRRTEPWASRIHVRHSTGKGIQVELPREHATLKATGRVELYRPSAAGADRSYPLALDAEGSQWLPADGITPGLWKVRLHWKVANEDYFADRELVIRGAGSRS
jgi:nitrogen fixation protein FixH